MAISSEEKQDLHDEGQRDVANGVIIGGGPSIRIFESSEDRQERQAAYDAGRDNAYKQMNNR
jgi:hypothetical protein